MSDALLLFNISRPQRLTELSNVTQMASRTLAGNSQKTPDGQVRLSVPELRHLLTALLWRGWHGIEHLLHWSEWRRRHQFRAMCCHYRKRGSPLPAFYLQL